MEGRSEERREKGMGGQKEGKEVYMENEYTYARNSCYLKWKLIVHSQELILTWVPCHYPEER